MLETSEVVKHNNNNSNNVKHVCYKEFCFFDEFVFLESLLDFGIHKECSYAFKRKWQVSIF